MQQTTPHRSHLMSVVSDDGVDAVRGARCGEAFLHMQVCGPGPPVAPYWAYCKIGTASHHRHELDNVMAQLRNIPYSQLSPCLLACSQSRSSVDEG